MKYWLMKTEPTTYSIDDLRRDKKTPWDGVRNYQARNFMMREMEVGDKVLFYHSNAEPPGIVGIAEVASEAYPDETQFDSSSKYYDAKARKEKPRWYLVDVKFVEKFKQMITLEELKHEEKLHEMKVVQKGQRLSVQPVSKKEFEIVIGMSKQ